MRREKRRKTKNEKRKTGLESRDESESERPDRAGRLEPVEPVMPRTDGRADERTSGSPVGEREAVSEARTGTGGRCPSLSSLSNLSGQENGRGRKVDKGRFFFFYSHSRLRDAFFPLPCAFLRLGSCVLRFLFLFLHPPSALVLPPFPRSASVASVAFPIRAFLFCPFYPPRPICRPARRWCHQTGKRAASVTRHARPRPVSGSARRRCSTFYSFVGNAPGRDSLSCHSDPAHSRAIAIQFTRSVR